MGAEPFSADRYELPLAEGGALTLLPLPTSQAQPLAVAFAAIDPWASYRYPASALAAYLAKQEPGAPRFLLCANREVAGAIGLRIRWLHGPYIQFLGILPGFQRRGLGRTALAWVEAEARANNGRNVWVVASEINADAICFYERYGFVQTAHLHDLAYDGRTEILMRKRL